MIKRLIFCLSMLCLICNAAAFGADANDPVLPVDKLTVVYARNVKGLPDQKEIEKLEVKLGSELGGDGKIVYENYIPGRNATFFTIDSLSKGGLKEFHASAIRAVAQRITKYINDQGFVVVQVQPDPEQMNPTGTIDKRGDNKDLKLIISMGVVTEVRTVASGNRVPKDQRVDNPLHKAISEGSPVNPTPGHSLVRKDELDAYVFFLNRHPGRHVDISVAQAQSREGEEVPQGDIVLDYLIAENKPWSVVVQGSNTGTAQTSAWRERFGFTQNQLTDHDDVFSIDYTTSSFDGKSSGGGFEDHLGALFDARSQSADISYDAPVPKLQKLRYKVYGSYDAFTASDLGTGSENFIGEQENLAGEITYNVFQQRDQFIDSYVGAQYSHIRANLNPFAFPGLTGGADIAEPYVGVRAERDSDIATTVGSLTFRYGLPFDRTTSTHANEGAAGLNQLGRASVNGNFPLLQADIMHSFFIEPILNPRAFEAGQAPVTTASQPAPAPVSTLANEVVLAGRGQYSGGQRLIPQEQEPVGGLYSVRGYPESFVAGDTVAIGSVEYRLHIPRLLKVEPNPDKTRFLGRPFRWSPQQAYGQPDWDLITRAFFDAGYAHNYSNGSRIAEPSDAALFGTGVGLELQISPDQLPRIDLRADYGVALRGAYSGDQHTSAGSQRFSFVFTLVY